jgi:hypothetical protein
MNLLFLAWLHSGAEHWPDKTKKRSVCPEYKPPCFQWNYFDSSLVLEKNRIPWYFAIYIFMSLIVKGFFSKFIYSGNIQKNLLWQFFAHRFWGGPLCFVWKPAMEG